MLSDLFDVRYRHPKKTPIQLVIIGNALLIDCRFNHQLRALRPDSGTGQTIADIIEESIVQRWSGKYNLNLPDMTDPIEVNVIISRSQDRRSVPIRLRHLLLMPPHIISPVYRRFWGLFKTGHLESLGANWNTTQPGCMVLPIGLNKDELSSIAAHEAGHLFGIGDAYAAIYRFYDAVPGAEQYMMFSNQTVHPDEILMMLKAHVSNRMQYFPLTWNTSRFFRGLRRDIVERGKYLAKQWKNYHKVKKDL